MKRSGFKAGSGCYTCRCCKRQTRDVGEDGPDVRLCAECYTLAGEENHLSDTGTFYDRKSEVLRLIQAVADKGGNAGCWAHLKAEASK